LATIQRSESTKEARSRYDPQHPDADTNDAPPYEIGQIPRRPDQGRALETVPELHLVWHGGAGNGSLPLSDVAPASEHELTRYLDAMLDSGRLQRALDVFYVYLADEHHCVMGRSR
jgi:hypothetical protein